MSFSNSIASLVVENLSTGIAHSGSGGAITSSLLVNADVHASAGIVDTKLATISTALKVSNSATTAVSTNTASAIVTRDDSGNFSAGTITASLTGNVSGNLTGNLTGNVTGNCTGNSLTASSTALLSIGSTGYGVIPLGGVIATMSHLTGAYNCTATTAADSNGFVQCNGQTISDATSPMNGVIIPNINSDVFLMGNTTAGSANGSNNTTLTSTQLPGHTHDINHTHGSFTSGNESATHNHVITVGVHVHSIAHDHPSTTSSSNGLHSHSFHVGGSGGSWGIVSASVVTATPGIAGLMEDAGAHTHTTDIPNYTGDSASTTPSGSAGNASATHTHSTNITALGSTQSTSTGSGSAYDSRPKYISAKFCIRIK